MRRFGLVLLAFGMIAANAFGADDIAPLERVRVAADGKGFTLEPSGRAFAAWGFNYDHDEKGRLIEDYWDAEWPKVVEDFREMAEHGANVVRVHLQFGKFMESAEQPNERALERLGKLLEVAELNRLYLDLTGLGCYHKADVPAWYDALDEEARWAAQARFWEAVAARCSKSSAIFCYDLMNEPVVPGGRNKDGDWLGPGFGDKHFVQFITLDRKDRPRPEVARKWIETLVTAIKKHDARGLVTVGFVDWSLDRPGLTSGFVPDKVAGPLDFICVHLYPESGKVAEAIKTLEGFAAVGKPVVIEETYTLKSSMSDFKMFLEESRKIVSGWVGFYWGRTLEECKQGKTFSDAFMASWLEAFRELGPTFRKP